jgi:hypothetical protein
MFVCVQGLNPAFDDDLKLLYSMLFVCVQGLNPAFDDESYINKKLPKELVLK